MHFAHAFRTSEHTHTLSLFVPPTYAYAYTRTLKRTRTYPHTFSLPHTNTHTCTHFYSHALGMIVVFQYARPEFKIAACATSE